MADDYKDLISEGDDFDGTIVMADEEGNEISFTFLDLLDYEGESYVLLLPTQEELANEVVILRVTEEDGEEFYERQLRIWKQLKRCFPSSNGPRSKRKIDSCFCSGWRRRIN